MTDLRFVGLVEVETPRALLFQDHFWHEPKWFPKSQVKQTLQVDSLEVIIDASSWICGKNDLSEFKELFKPEDGKNDST